MTRYAALALSFLMLPLITACMGDETVGRYGAAGRVWQLTELDGATFTSRATLTFPEPGKIAGQAPCNLYFGTMAAPYPWFRAEKIGATAMACSELSQETAFLRALEQMTLSEVSGDRLILSNEQGREMVFTAVKPGV
ncbi:MAG: META domain-containing protein [Rhodobacterales bacterium]|nr:MAG: META domain-containing protein [Rhodobacterales bacterium]